MESVKATLPRRLLQRIEVSHDGDLEVTCSALASHLASNVNCSQLLEQLADPNKTTCAKDSETALDCKRGGNAAFGTNSFRQALDSYTKAIRYAPLATDADVPTLATLFVNRAAALHALGLLDAAARDCTRAINLQPESSKAWYRRGRVWADLQSYGKASKDLEKALFLEKSANGRKQVSRELDKVKILTDVAKHDKSNKSGSRICKSGESCVVDGVSSYWTSEKQWGLQATTNLAAGSLVLEEEPVAALILKGHRNTHCHFCFELLPPDPLACMACAIPVYCHEGCRTAACEESSQELEGQRWKGEHMHECGGASWSAVLPTDAVLAARLLVRGHGNALVGKQLNDLCHHYNELSGAAKVDAHVMAAVMAHCLSCYPANSIEQTVGDVAAKLVCLVAVVRANAMAISAVQFPADGTSSSTHDLKDNIDKSLLSLVEQVNVAQGVYSLSSKLNHSCKTNLHASFKNRRVRVRTIEPVQAGFPLELCYGPQVGETKRDERQAWLQDRYFFTCACPSCETVVQPDLLLFAFRCSKAGCDGVVPGCARDDATEGNMPKAGLCMSCGTAVDMQYCTDAAKAVKMELERLESELQPPRSNQEALLQGALNLLKQCQTIFHASSKEIAKAEDVVAEALCFMGRPNDALPHCRLAIQILENIYGENHIAVANERLKLASIALAANSRDEVQSNLALVDQVMRIHYGADYRSLLHLEPAFHQLEGS